MPEISFFVDGFNPYHSLADAQRDHAVSAKWLDVRALLTEGLAALQQRHAIHRIEYFSALAHHRCTTDAGTVQRHEAFLSCLRESGVRVRLGQFKKCRMHCKLCGARFTRYEEKESDVAIGVSLLGHLMQDGVDAVAVVSADTDLVPALREARRLFPNKRVGVVFPYRRVHDELRQVAHFHWKLKAPRYAACQFPNPFRTRTGRAIAKPSSW